VPLIQGALANCWVLRGRCYSAAQPACAPLRAVLDAARDDALPLFVLWPGASAVAAEAAASALAGARAAARARRAAGGGAGGPSRALAELSLEERVRRCAFALLLPDGTWQQCREMMTRLTPHLPPPACLLRLPAAAQPQTPLLSEPAPGCMMTCEAVAHALSALEGEAAQQQPVLEAMMAPMRAVLALQSAHGAPAKGIRPGKRQMRLPRGLIVAAAETAA